MKTEITLYIDSADSQKVIVGLSIEGKKEELISESNVRGSQVVLQMIHDLLEKNGISIHELTNIEVNPGPGSYTGLRVGAAVGNSLAFILKIPINNLPIGVYMQPVYK